MKKFIGREGSLLFVWLLILLSFIAIRAHGAVQEPQYIKGFCWSKNLDLVMCKIKSDSDKIWIQDKGWTNNYIIIQVISSPEVDGELLLHLIKKGL